MGKYSVVSISNFTSQDDFITLVRDFINTGYTFNPLIQHKLSEIDWRKATIYSSPTNKTLLFISIDENFIYEVNKKLDYKQIIGD